jgi:ribosomal protein L29
MKFLSRIKDMSIAELEDLLKELRMEMFRDKTKINHDGKPVREKDIGKMIHKKKNIARVMTELRLRGIRI